MVNTSTDGGEGTISKRPRRHSPSPSLRAIPTPPPQQQMEDEDELEEEIGEEVEEEEEDEDNEGEEQEEGDEEVEEEEGESESERGVSLPPPEATGKSTFISFNDTEVLDCPICMEALTIPVLQCPNGHTACSACYNKLANKCPSCSVRIGYIRNRAIEKVLESVTVLCQNAQYGCQKRISYSKKREHDMDCVYIPILCPVIECNFSGSCNQLYQHFRAAHSTSVIKFSYLRGFTIPIFFRDADVCLILQDNHGLSFILHHKVEFYGNAITINCLRPSSSKENILYDLEVCSSRGSSLKFQSYTKNIGTCYDHWPTSAEFLLIPRNFFSSALRELNLKITFMV